MTTSRWTLALAGLALTVFALLSLTGPGRIDIVDGQARYEVARSLALHGDSQIRDPNVWFNVFPGPEGRRYTYYRLPHSLLGVPAVWVADLLGPESETRRQFCFVLVSAATAAMLAVTFAVAFRIQGLSPRAACWWALGGIVTTPCWYYGTSAFDEIYCSVALVGAIVAVGQARNSSGWLVAAAGLLALAVNCKQPLGAFVLLALALADDTARPIGVRLRRAGVLLAGVVLGGALHFGYFWLKYPPGQTPDHTEALKIYAQVWPGDTPAALLALAVSPGAGVLWYAPAVLLTLSGLGTHWRSSPRVVTVGLLAAAAFVGFIASMTIFKGELAWGPRYLTPLLALGWLLAPTGAARLPRFLTGFILTTACVVQILSLAVDPHRLYLEHRLGGPILPAKLYFYQPLAHLVQRPREIAEVVRSDAAAATEFTPSWLPTVAPLALEHIPLDERGPRRYVIFDTLRPWWASFRHLPPDERPIDLAIAGVGFGLVGGLGLVLLTLGLRRGIP